LADATREVEIVNKRGLHARASAKFVALVSEMQGAQVTVKKDSQAAAGGSILGLMMLGAAKGDRVELEVSGDDAEARLEQLVALVEDGFGEDRVQ
jgi:phosphocarrier protein